MTERIITDSNGRKHITTEPLLHPPQRTWVELTEEDYVLISQLCKAKLEAAEYAAHLLKEKNNG